MADKTIKIAVVLSAYDIMTAGISQAVTRSVSKLKSLSDETGALSKSAFAFVRDTWAIGIAAAGLLADPLKAAADMEKMQVALKTALGGSAKEAEKSFKIINDFAARAPYGLEEVMSGFIKLKNLGLEAFRENEITNLFSIVGGICLASRGYPGGEHDYFTDDTGTGVLTLRRLDGCNRQIEMQREWKIRVHRFRKQ